VTAGNYTTFNVPGAIETNPAAINSSGAIAGAYFGDKQMGFVRDTEGNITTFEARSNPEATGIYKPERGINIDQINNLLSTV
jgi:hypothetical protein